MAQLNPTWPFPTSPTSPQQENAMWIEVESPYYQTIRADRVESVKVVSSHSHDPADRYRVVACIGDREYVVDHHCSQSDAHAGAKNLQALLDNA